MVITYDSAQINQVIYIVDIILDYIVKVSLKQG